MDSSVSRTSIRISVDVLLYFGVYFLTGLQTGEISIMDGHLLSKEPWQHSELRLFTLGIFRNLISHQIFTLVLIVRKINLNFAFHLKLLNHWPAIYNWWNFYHSELPSKSRISRQIDCIWLLQISSWERVPKEIIFQWTIIFFGTYSSAKYWATKVQNCLCYLLSTYWQTNQSKAKARQ